VRGYVYGEAGSNACGIGKFYWALWLACSAQRAFSHQTRRVKKHCAFVLQRLLLAVGFGYIEGGDANKPS
jgi:hypothetical protein